MLRRQGTTFREGYRRVRFHTALGGQCAKRKDAFIAEYSRCSKDYSITVKEGNPKDSSYVGILKYKQEKFKSSGMTREIAKNGTFQRTGGGVPVTELFLYRNGRWQ